MNFTRDEVAGIFKVLETNDRSFRNLVRVAGLRPDRDLVGADLRRVDFGADDFSGFDFAGTDIAGANLAGAHGLRAEMFVGAHFDETTRWPNGLREAVRGFDVEDAAEAMILAGRAPPVSWRPFIRRLAFSNPESPSASFRNDERYKKASKNGEKFANPAPLADLTSLQSLDLRGTQVSDVAPLARLANLQSLDLWNTQVSDVAPLASLANLQSLDLSGTQVSDVAPLASLANLQSLDLIDTQVSDVAPLASLANLQSLDLMDTQVSDVAPLAGLTDAAIARSDETRRSATWRRSPASPTCNRSI